MRAFVIILTLIFGTTAAADPLQDRLNQISAEITTLFEQFSAGKISEEDLFARTDALTNLDMQLRTGQITLEDLNPVRWRDHDQTPKYTAGFDLVIEGLPEGFSSPVWATLPDGRRLDVETFRNDTQPPTEMTLTLPVHPEGIRTGDLLTFHFGGSDPINTLTAELAPIIEIEDALPRLFRLTTGLLIDDLQADGISPEALVTQIRTAPETVDPEYGFHALALWAWSESKRGNQALAFMQDGRFDTVFWRGFGLETEENWNLVASAVLQNTLTPELEKRPTPEVLDRIKAPKPHQSARIIKARSGLFEADVTDTNLAEIADLVVRGRELKQYREQVVSGLKTAHKVGDLALNWTTETAVASLAIGGLLTATDQALRKKQRHLPTTIEIRSRPLPDDLLLADDSRALDPTPTLFAKSEPYEALAMADGVDLALLLTDIALLAGEKTKFGQALKVGELTLRQTAMLKTGTFIAKETGERTEKLGQLAAKDSFTIYKIPGRTWRAPITEKNYRSYVTIEYAGEARPSSGYFGKACWAGTGQGAYATIDAVSSVFGGAFDREVAAWPVSGPELAITPATGVLEPGETTAITFERSGAEAVNIRTFPPALGTLSNVTNDGATYTAPSEIASCSETVLIEAEYPTGAEAGNICTAPPRFSGPVFIKKGDASILTPTQLTCRDGEVLGFTVSHARGSEVQCTLSGPGTLTMVGNEGLLDCPVEPRQPSAITCFTGQAPGQCAPVIPIKRIFPEFAVSAFVSADRRKPLNENVEDFFSDCGVEDMTTVALELMDLGTGEADTAPVDLISNNCPRPQFARGGGVSGNGGSPSQIETFAEGGYVANWPLGEGRDVSVSDTNSYSHRPYDPGRGPGDRSVLVTSDIAADIIFGGPERFLVETHGSTVARSIRTAEETPDPSGGYAQWAVWRRIVVTEDTEVTASIQTDGPATTLVQAIPLRLENNVPIALLTGFDQGLSSVMMVASTSVLPQAAAGSDSSKVRLPGPRQDGESLTYLLLFNGRTTPALAGDDRVTAASRTIVELDITPVK